MRPIFLEAVNRGRPIVLGDTGQPVATLIEDLAYRVSLTRHPAGEGAKPTPALLPKRPR